MNIESSFISAWNHQPANDANLLAGPKTASGDPAHPATQAGNPTQPASFPAAADFAGLLQRELGLSATKNQSLQNDSQTVQSDVYLFHFADDLEQPDADRLAAAISEALSRQLQPWSGGSAGQQLTLVSKPANGTPVTVQTDSADAADRLRQLAEKIAAELLPMLLSSPDSRFLPTGLSAGAAKGSGSNPMAQGSTGQAAFVSSFLDGDLETEAAFRLSLLADQPEPDNRGTLRFTAELASAAGTPLLSARLTISQGNLILGSPETVAGQVTVKPAVDPGVVAVVSAGSAALAESTEAVPWLRSRLLPGSQVVQNLVNPAAGQQPAAAGQSDLNFMPGVLNPVRESQLQTSFNSRLAPAALRPALTQSADESGVERSVALPLKVAPAAAEQAPPALSMLARQAALPQVSPPGAANPGMSFSGKPEKTMQQETDSTGVELPLAPKPAESLVPVLEKDLERGSATRWASLERLSEPVNLADRLSQWLSQLEVTAAGAGQMAGRQLQTGALPGFGLNATGLQFLPAFIDHAGLAQRVLDAAHAAQSAGSGLYEARLELNPPQLGRMLAQIAVQGEHVVVQLAVGSGLPRRQMEESLAGLKRSLEEAGLEVNGLRVVTLDPETDGSSDSGREQDAQHELMGLARTKRLVGADQSKQFKLFWQEFEGLALGSAASS